MTTIPGPDHASPQEPRPTLPKKHSSGSLPDIKPASTVTSPSIDDRLSASTPDFPQTPSKSLPQRIRTTESPKRPALDRSLSAGARSLSPAPAVGNEDEPKQIIVRSFAPRVAVYASADTEDFVRAKGFNEGLRGVLRPYGERIPGKVVVRDSVGSSKAWDDFGIRIVAPEDGQPFRTSQSRTSAEGNSQLDGGRRKSGPRESLSSANGGATAFERLIEHHLKQEEGPRNQQNGYPDSPSHQQKPNHITSSVYPLYLRKLFSSMLLVPYETFLHPVACIIAVSSHDASPIETLRQLYTLSGRRIPAFVGAEYLRYYVLIHDDEHSDITKSTALFDLMKRHFGLHCHLLRLRSSQCVQSDDDSVVVPRCEWLPPEEDLEQSCSLIDYSEEDSGDGEKYIFDSDAASIRAFLREMLTQSIVPFMEHRIMTWNDQVASRRRGLSGRFTSLTKRWTAFGSRSSSNPSGTSNQNSNYDAQQGFYPPETPEATMRTLADYAFMLRDFRLAYSTYEFLRSDFAHDKAWAYHAAANEMAAISYLLIPQTYGREKSRSETVDTMLDTAAYSYLTRCSLPFGVIRGLIMAIELLKARGASTAENAAARWGGRLLELGVLNPTAQAFIAERMAECYRGRGSVAHSGPRSRQAALWSLIAAQSWLRAAQPMQAEQQLDAAGALYTHYQSRPLPFESMSPLWDSLQGALSHPRQQDRDGDSSLTVVDPSRNTSTPHVEREQLNTPTTHIPSIGADPLGVGAAAQADGGRNDGDDGFE